MRVLQLHNYYRIRGGECAVVDAERAVLTGAGVAVELLARHSRELNAVGAVRKSVELLRIPWNLSAARDVARVVRARRPDVAHVHNIFPLLSPSVYGALAHAGIPVVQTVHNFRFLCPNGLFFRNGRVCEECLSRGLWSAIRNRCLHNSRVVSGAYAAAVAVAWGSGILRDAVTRYVALNRFAADKLVAAGVPEERVRVLGNFVDVRGNVERQRGNYVLYLGRLSGEKGLYTLLAASEQLPEVRIVVAGDGPLRGQLQNWVEAHPSTRVEFMGFVGGEVKERLLREALCTVAPSECYENFPLSVVESLAHGTPVVAARMGGLAEIVRDGETGLLFTPGEADKLADSLRALAAQPERARAMGQAAFRDAQERFSASRHVAGLLEIYQEAIWAAQSGGGGRADKQWAGGVGTRGSGCEG